MFQWVTDPKFNGRGYIWGELSHHFDQRSVALAMSIVTICSKFRIVIPRDIRRSLGLVRGQKVHVMAVGERVALIPWRSARKMRGFLTDAVKPFERENDRL